MNEENVSPLVLKRSGEKSTSDFEPIVLKYKKRKQKKNRIRSDEAGEKKPEYSRNLKDVQKVEGDMVGIAHRASQAVTKGFESYDKSRKKSAKSKKDGAIEDFPHNATKAVSDSLKEASEIPVDIVDSLLTRNYRKQMRRNLRQASRAIKIFRL